MHILGLDGRHYIWNIASVSHPRGNTSKYHKKAKNILTLHYPFDKIYEEVTLPGSKHTGNDLKADFYIPKHTLVVEVQGEQHYVYNSHFYSTKLEFHRASVRDKIKRQWCELNNIYYVTFIYSESEEEWKNKLCQL